MVTKTYPDMDDDWIEVANFLELLSERIRKSVDEEGDWRPALLRLNCDEHERAAIRAAFASLQEVTT